jgi:hypothetical protein
MERAMIRWVVGFSLFASAALAQSQGTVPNHAIPIGKGPGISGFGAAVPGISGACLTSAGANSDPIFTTCGASAVLQVKISSAIATTANITLCGEQTIDGVLTSTTRVLVKDQTDSTQNGIYTSHSGACPGGAWTRTTDMNSNWDIQVVLAYVFTTGGSTNGGTGWTTSVVPGGTIGATPMPWVQFLSNTTYSAGSGLVQTGTVFSADSGTSGHKLPFLDGTNTWANAQTFNANVSITTPSPSPPIVLGAVTITSDTIIARPTTANTTQQGVMYFNDRSSTGGGYQLAFNITDTTSTLVATAIINGGSSSGNDFVTHHGDVDFLTYGPQTATGTITIVSGTPNLTVTGASFVSGDVGARIAVLNAVAGSPPTTLYSTIATVTDGTHVILANNATASVSASGTVYYGIKQEFAMAIGQGTLSPNTPNLYNIGTDAARWLGVYSRNLYAGTIGAPGTIVVKGATGTATITPPATGTPSLQLPDATGTFLINGVNEAIASYTNGPLFVGSTTAGAGISLQSIDTGGHKYDLAAAGTGNIGFSDGQFFIFDATASAFRFVIDSVGRVGFGGQTNPAVTVDVTGTINATVGYNINGTPGAASCSGAPTAGFTVIHGIVTAC